MKFEFIEQSILYTRAGEQVKISAYGKNSLRFQGSPSGHIIKQDWVIQPALVPATCGMQGENAFIENGTLKAVITKYGKVTFYRNGVKILEEKPELAFGTGIRNYRNTSGDLWKARVTFCSNENEHFYGLGHEATGQFDLKGSTLDLRHVNAKCSLPFVYSSLGYGFLWNQPSTGTCELANNRTRFSSDSTRQIDYVVIGGTPKEVLATLTDLTGHAPQMPEWAMGFWQCKLRYETQEQLLEVARKYHELGIPLSVIVIDYFHWTEQGDYRFDSKYWPDPKAMSDELHKMGIKLMVSMWPTINEKSVNYYPMLEENMLIRTASGSNRVFDFYGPQAEIDPTNPATRAYVYEKLKEGYLDQGVDALWFDEAEPEIHPEHFDNLLFHIGRGDEVGLLYPNYYSQLVYDGMKKDGRDDIITLSRAAFLGAQKYGTLVWSGDIPSTFESLSNQVKSGLNMAMCGIPWWTTDIGGFYGADWLPKEQFKELLIRWFQYGTFCPVMRLHGNRGNQDRTTGIKEPSGAANEIWSFGDDCYEILKDLILLREQLKPYIKEQMQIASETGTPIMRPLFFDFPEDENCYSQGEEYLFGPDLLIAPITRQGQTDKEVYVPKGNWILARNLEVYEGEHTYTITAQINEMIILVRQGAQVMNVFQN